MNATHMERLLDEFTGSKHWIFELCIVGGLVLWVVSIQDQRFAPVALLLLAIGVGGILYYAYSILWLLRQ
jgi:hypothetical protein